MINIQINELLNLIADLASIPIIFFVFYNKNLPRYPLFIIALILIILSHFFTIVETFILENIFNFFEHLCLLLSGGFFLTGILKYFIINENRK